MKHLVLIGALGVTGIVQATAATSLKLIETSVHSRVGFDSNPAGTSGTSAAVLGDDDTLIYAAGAGFALGAGGAGEGEQNNSAEETGEGGEEGLLNDVPASVACVAPPSLWAAIWYVHARRSAVQ